jgi:uncharacterized protein (TIRG00374 family)
MTEQSWARRHWKLILNIVTLVALLVTLYISRDQVAETIKNFRHVNGWVLLLILPIEFLNYHAQAKMYEGLFKIVGNKLSYKNLFRISLELNFVNHVFPSGGVTGLSYFSLRLRQGRELTASKATLVHVAKLMMVFLSFEVLIVFALFSLAVRGHISNVTMLLAAVISTLLIVGTGLFVYIVGSRSRINSFFTAATRAINRIIKVVRPRHPETISIEKARFVFNDFHDNYKLIKQSLNQLHRPFWYALLANVTEVLAIYVVYIAFGHFVNIGAVILAYAVANFAGMVSVLPGGVGIYEALMTIVLASTGVPAGISLPVTVMYRVLNTVIQIPPGYYFYQKAIVTENAQGQEHVA